MPTFHKGDMWQRYGKVDMFCITTNGIIKNNGRLVMGAGISKEAKIRIKDIDLIAGKAVDKEYCRRPLPYGFLPVTENLALFQTKYHWSDKSDLGLIALSCTMMNEYINKYGGIYALNFPGIGYGGLSRWGVLPIIEKLPDNVEIWEY